MFYFLHALVWVITLLPLRILYVLSDIFYPIVYYIIKYRKSVVRTNIEKSFPEKSKKELRKIERGFYRFFCDLFIESIYQININDAEIKRRFEFVNADAILQHYAEKNGVMIMTSHYGNWEWGTNFSLFSDKKVASCQIYKQLSNVKFNALMYKLRAKHGGINIEKRELLRAILRLKSENNFALYWMISDQTPAQKKIHYWTNFLNQDTPALTGSEQLARKFDYPVYYAEVKCIKRGYYQCELIPISLEPAKTEEFEITEKYMQMLQKTIEAQPEYWLWSHRRWKYARN